ncbi:hypothetical protein HY947_00355 [Candidatus Gottesmanbacteria bacterium]|nr:hypothetical protein [Candidatus Gottesmanbacteria bacterium]
MPIFSMRVFVRIFFVCFLLGLTVSLFVFGTKKKAEVKKDELYFKTFRKRAEGWIRTLGGEKAYKRVKEEFKENPNDSHGELHVFGELLYTIEGLTSFTVCDQDFGFGCYHGFMGQAIAEKGVDVAYTLDAECIKRHGPHGLGCFHGLGHGLGEYFGPNRINEQLKICKSLSWKGLYAGCQDGAIMEYHFPTSQTGIGTRQQLKIFQKDNPYDPCPTVEDMFKRACYYRLPSWWNELFHDFDKIGDLCGAVDDNTERKSCFLGIGNAFHPQYKINQSEIQVLCKTAKKYTDGAYCYAGSRWALFVLGRTDDASALCESLSEEDKVICMTKWNLIEYTE